jgi:hypothetical protein
LHKAVPLFQTCPTSEFVYDHACFCVYVYLSDLSSMYERKHVAFVFRMTKIKYTHISMH